MGLIEDYLGITAICGDEGSGKTTMALSFPKPLRHFDIDVGGYRRAAWRMEMEGVATKAYPRPIQINKLLGQQKEEASTRINFPKKVEGMKELWQTVVTDFVAACQDAEVATIVLDSATLLWTVCHNGVLQETQERQLANFKKNNQHTPFDENDYRERLQPVEYGPANDRMRQLLHTARSFQKNLVITHYPTDEYGAIPDGKGNMVEGKTGIKIMDGFKETLKLSDLVVWTSIKSQMVLLDPKNPQSQKMEEKYPSAKITKCGIEGMGLSAVGLEIPATYEAFINIKNAMLVATKERTR